MKKSNFIFHSQVRHFSEIADPQSILDPDHPKTLSRREKGEENYLSALPAPCIGRQKDEFLNLAAQEFKNAAEKNERNL